MCYSLFIASLATQERQGTSDMSSIVSNSLIFSDRVGKIESVQ